MSNEFLADLLTGGSFIALESAIEWIQRANPMTEPEALAILEDAVARDRVRIRVVDGHPVYNLMDFRILVREVRDAE